MTDQPTLFDTPTPLNGSCPTCQRPYTLQGDGKIGTNHPKTSQRAATLPKFGTQRYKILEFLVVNGPHTAHGISQWLPQSPNQIATRLQELREAGLVTYTTENGVKQEAPTTNNNTGYLQQPTQLGFMHIRQQGKPCE